MPDNKTPINRDISDDECFTRIVRFPYSFKDNKIERASAERIKTRALFMPIWSKITLKLEGVSLDRIVYCAPLTSKENALNNFGMFDETSPVYKGMAFIKHSSIREINTIPLGELIATQTDNDEEEKISPSLTSLREDINASLEGFDTSCLDNYCYCGIIATPVDNQKPNHRISPPDLVYIDDDGNPAHAEIFYLLTDGEPNNPNATIIQEVSRRLQAESIIKIDLDALSRETAPDFR